MIVFACIMYHASCVIARGTKWRMLYAENKGCVSIRQHGKRDCNVGFYLCFWFSFWFSLYFHCLLYSTLLHSTLLLLLFIFDQLQSGWCLQEAMEAIAAHEPPRDAKEVENLEEEEEDDDDKENSENRNTNSEFNSNSDSGAIRRSNERGTIDSAAILPISSVFHPIEDEI